ncbi:hypothetical protein D3C81_304930 [compost metagenome]
MGLDVDLVKFDKAFYDSVKGPDGKVDYHDGHKHYKKLGYWRKHYDVRDLLADRCDLRHDQCDFGELSRLDLKKVLRQAMRKKQIHPGVDIDRDEMRALIPVLRKTLHQVNFHTETVALSWIS